MTRACFSLGCRNVTEFLHVTSAVAFTLTAPFASAGVAFDVRIRGFLEQEMTEWLHAGASAGMPLRCQLVFDFSVFDAGVWNSVMASHMIDDLRALAVSGTVDVSAQQFRDAMSAMEQFITSD